jgi:hypothetical protein
VLGSHVLRFWDVILEVFWKVAVSRSYKASLCNLESASVAIASTALLTEAGAMLAFSLPGGLASHVFSKTGSESKTGHSYGSLTPYPLRLKAADR